MNRNEAVLDFAAFAGTVAIAVLQQWQAKDLVWSLWISSLVLGYAFIVASAFSVFFRSSTPDSGASAAWRSLLAALPLSPALVFLGKCLSVVFLLVFFTIHFGMFHFVHGLFLNMFFPLADWRPFGRSPDDVSSYFVWSIGLTARAYWPFIVLSAVSRLSDFGNALKAPGGPNMSMPYANVVRMHIMIFIFAGLYGAGLATYAVYPVLVLYFFPAGSLAKLAIRKRRAVKQSNANPYSRSRVASEGSSRSK